ncbi:MAG: MBOAT family protein [Eubacterium sp.]|nr:MBOAT family protein [Eubacterium sp.]
MVFSSKIFLFLFLPVVFVMYYGGIRKIRIHSIKYQNLLLFIASLLFYAYGELKYVFLLMLVILFNWLMALKMTKTIFIFTILSDVFILVYFKYFNLITQTFYEINVLQKTNVTNIVLPIGISFYMFQVLSYVIDVYMGKAEPCRNIIDVGLYVALFPQLIAGPIVRYNDISEQIKYRDYDYNRIANGFYRFSYGLAKKVLIADYLDFAAVSILGNAGNKDLSILLCWFGALCYTLQIYFDFSGYSDMAIGLSAMFGFKLNENFNYPYISGTITEFWRRWHMSLSGWLKDYIYIPLGGNRCSKVRNILNLFIVWCVTGIWHGANWTFLLWGIWYFIFIILERYIFKNANLNKSKRSTIGALLYRVITILVIVIGWVIFYENDMDGIYRIVGGMFGFTGIPFINNNFFEILKFYYILFPVAIIFSFPVYGKMLSFLKKDNKDSVNSLIAILVFILSLLVVYSHTNSPFIYFQF